VSGAAAPTKAMPGGSAFDHAPARLGFDRNAFSPVGVPRSPAVRLRRERLADAAP
jgi:hypothetical protein